MPGGAKVLAGRWGNLRFADVSATGITLQTVNDVCTGWHVSVHGELSFVA